MPLEAEHHDTNEGRRLVKFDPTVNTGTIIQIGTIIFMGALGFAMLQGELKTQKVELEAVKLAAERDNKRNEEALREIKTDVRELQKSINDIKEGVAILRGRAADVGSKR
ncbi:hypothetical protein [Pseudorhodoferax sp. Leaf265]|uniref:hypothetical protein n=1 Tax=Pseudorhodoferax sp. Leaf265 TaxID=1736315 RepID=UPI0006F88395|nr:hypothetical protein [Pseudorhodoferax sp. Leaf265]KQP02444.1 hypothetical protein ASF45_20535 [Pseudorhodoferax sp. Leaf265]